MQSRKSSILKPRKAREPLQDLNQLLLNNDDEETTTTDAQRRRVSFASTNKVKEFEIASECVGVVNAPPVYDKRYSLSTDLCQPAVVGKNTDETQQVSNLSRKSIPNAFLINSTRQSIVDENIYFVEDVELTETIGRIYDIPMKSSGDSSMELTHVISQTEIQFDERSEEVSEVIGPLNLTKENFNQTSSLSDAHILEIEIVNKNENDADTSSMETTEVISNNIISIEKPDTEILSMESTEVISNNIRIETSDFNKASIEATEVFSSNFEKSLIEENSSMETTEVIYDNMLSESIKSRSVFFETVQSSQCIDDVENQEEDIEYVSIPRLDCTTNIPKRKSIFEMSAHSQTNWDIRSIDNCEAKLNTCEESLSFTCQGMVNRIDAINSNIQTPSQEFEHRFNAPNESALTQNIDDEMEFNSFVKTSTQEMNDKTKYDLLSMQLLSQEIEKINDCNTSKLNNSNMKLLSQEDNKTKCNNSNMELLTQEDSKTKYVNSNMELLSQEDNRTKYNNSNMELLSQEDNRTKYNNSNMELLTQEDDTNNPKFLNDQLNFSEVDTPALNVDPPRVSLIPQPADPQNCNVKNASSPRPTDVDSNELCEPNDVPLESTMRSSLGDDSSAGSNSPLTVGVNFSIFQKNKETRVEFSGTIDSSKKKKSISNVKVNIINNKTAKECKHVKELRFSMPATTKTSEEYENTKPDFSATFTDFSIPNEGSSLPSVENVVVPEAGDRACATEHPQLAETNNIAASNSHDGLNDDASNAQLTKLPKKRLSNDVFPDSDEKEICAKRRSLNNEANDSKKCTEPVTASSPEINCNGNEGASSALLMRRSYTEIKQRKESFVREEKSFVAIDDVVVETCARSTNTNISYETRQMATVCDHQLRENVRPQSSQSADEPASKSGSSSTSPIGTATEADDPSCGDELAAGSDENVSNQFCDGDLVARCQSIDQSSTSQQEQEEEEEEINENSLHNPSIIVNIGDSFSYYKSMDSGADSDSAGDVRESVAPANEAPAAKPVIDYIDSDDMSKENFVVEWLQNKTGKATVVDNRHLIALSSNASTTKKSNVTRGSEKSNVVDGVAHAADRQKDEATDRWTCSERSEPTLAGESNAGEPTVAAGSNAIAPIERGNAEVCEVPNDELVATSQTAVECNAEVVPEIRSPNVTGAEEDAVCDMENDELAVPVTHEPPAPPHSNDVNGDDCMDVVPGHQMDLSGDESEPNSGDEKCDDQWSNMSEHAEAAEKGAVVCGSPVDDLQTSKTKTRSSTEPVFSPCQLTAEKRQRFLTECEIAERESGKVAVSRDIFVPTEERAPKPEAAKKAESRSKHRHHQTLATSRKDILEKLDSMSKSGDQIWKFKTISDEKWVFQLFFDQLELVIEFSKDRTSNTCNAFCQYVQPAHIKYYEISQIAIEYLIRKNKSKLKQICHSVEDVPYLLKLIEPDVDYVEGFVTDVLKLCDREMFKVKNGRAVFYVYSFKYLMSAKIQINISRLEKISVKDVQVKEIVGKADINAIRNTFAEAGRDCDFLSKFIKKLWFVLEE